MTYNELQTLAKLIVQEQASSKEWMEAFVKAQSEVKVPSVKYVSAKTAAEMLGMSVWQLYRIKGHLTHKKSGKEQSSTLKFDAWKLVEDYERYIASKKAVLGLVEKRYAT